MDRWQAMRVFVKVAETGSFAEASRQLHMSPPAVTRMVSALEDQIGVRLLIRTTRSVKTTEAGDRYFQDCRRILADVAHAEASAAGAHVNPTGTLIVTASAMFGPMHVTPILLEYLERYPAVTGRSLFVDRVLNIVEDGIDVAVRIGHLPMSGLSAVRVGSVKRVICGAPSYFEKHGVPQVPGDLTDHWIVAQTAAWFSLDWHFGPARKNSVTIRPRLLCNTNEGAIAAVEQGRGISRLLTYQIEPALRSGRLRTVLTDYNEPSMPVHVVHAGGRRPAAKVRTFVDLAVERLRDNPIFGDV